MLQKNVLYLLIAAMAAGLMGFALGRNSDFALDIKVGKNSAKLDVKGGAVDYEKVLETIYQNDFLRGAARQWLADKHSLIAISDDRLANLLETKACTAIPDKPLDVRMKALKACADAPGNAQLRDLALRRHGYPFHPIGSIARTSVPSRKPDIPNPGGGSTCDRDLLTRRIEVYNPKNFKSIYITPTGYIPCSGFADTGTQLHLSPRDAMELFGGRPQGIQEVYVLPVA